MHRWIALASILFALSTSTSALAQDAQLQTEVQPRNRVGIDAAFVLPLDDYAELADFGVGALARWEFEATKEISVGARAGYVHHFGDYSGGIAPIHATFRYRIGEPGAAPYLRAELGVTIVWATVETGLGNVSDSDSNLSAALGGGYELGIVDIGAALILPDLDDAFGLMVTVGADLARF
jgi:hypothetical protein